MKKSIQLKNNIIFSILIFLAPYYSVSQISNENILNNKGEICTVVYGDGNQNITVNNNFQYYFPEEEIIDINNQLKEILKANGLLSKEKRKLIEKELNLTKKITQFEKKIESYDKQFNILHDLILKIDTLDIITKKELTNIKQLLTLGITATQNSKCLFEDYKFETIKDNDGNTYHRIERKIIDGDPNFIIVYPFVEGFAKIKQYNKYGFINENGDKIIPAKYDYANNFMDGTAVVGIKNYGGGIHYYFIANHNLLFKTAYYKIERINRDLALVNEVKSQGVCLIDRNRKIIKDTKSSSLVRDKDGFWIRTINKKIGKKHEIRKGLLSTRGHTILKAEYREISEKSNGYRAIQCENRGWGYLDENNKLYLTCYFSKANDFHSERAIVKAKIELGKDSLGFGNWFEKFGLINKDGAEVIPTYFDTIYSITPNEYKVLYKDEIFELNEYGVCKGNSKKKKMFKEIFIETKNQ